MDNLYLFEAGASKTALLYQVNGRVQEMLLPPFNPNRPYQEFQKAIEGDLVLNDNANVYFYGAGLTEQSNKEIVSSFFAAKNVSRLSIYDDIIGAARAAFGNSEGIICIMGTGGLAAYFDGLKVLKRRGGYGYLIDDLGGGFELGRRIISAWLKGDLRDESDQKLSQALGCSKDEITEQIYRAGRVNLISEVSKCLNDLQGDSKIDEILHTYFHAFVTENIKPLSEEFNINQFSIVGSVGTNYHRLIGVAAKPYGLSIQQCIQSPVKRLFDYHSRHQI